ncbi:cupin domain-containing protein [Pantoea agglomerans]|uniref:cupin domain-containing protein n=1 Tax=Enterobacter agglomerans TaxID=549 RepID=UPI00104CDA28|nr:cupin domain-containing protein [Pantoea agglomerans]TCZ22259.1 cupin domain-containing protein [Pantoea agglomerans]
MHYFKELDRTNLRFENNLHAQRTLPWANFNAPFESSWCVISPGQSSTPHHHHEYEIFVAVKGEAFILCEGKKTKFSQGDTVHFKPFTQHCVVNESQDDFEMYSIWWDTDMSDQFLHQHGIDNKAAQNV